MFFFNRVKLFFYHFFLTIKKEFLSTTLYYLKFYQNTFVFSRWLDFFIGLPPYTFNFFFNSNFFLTGYFVKRYFNVLNRRVWPSFENNPHIKEEKKKDEIEEYIQKPPELTIKPTTIQYFSINERITKDLNSGFRNFKISRLRLIHNDKFFWSISKVDNRLLIVLDFFFKVILFLKNFDNKFIFLKFFFYFFFGLGFIFFGCLGFLLFILKKFYFLHFFTFLFYFLFFLIKSIINLIKQYLLPVRYKYFKDGTKLFSLTKPKVPLERVSEFVGMYRDSLLENNAYPKRVPGYEGYTPFSGYWFYYLLRTRFNYYNPYFDTFLKVWFKLGDIFTNLFAIFFVLNSFFKSLVPSFSFYFYFIYPALFFIFFIDFIFYFVLRGFFLFITSVFYWFYFFIVLPFFYSIFSFFNFILFLTLDFLIGFFRIFFILPVFFFIIPFFTEQNYSIDWATFNLFKLLNWFSIFDFSLNSFLYIFYLYFIPFNQNTNQTDFLANFTLDFFLFFTFFGFSVLISFFFLFSFYPINSNYSSIHSSYSLHPDSSNKDDSYDSSEHLIEYDEDDFPYEEADSAYPLESEMIDDDLIEEDRDEPHLNINSRKFLSRDGRVYSFKILNFNFFSYLGLGPTLNEFFESKHLYETTQQGFDVFSNLPNRFYNSPLENFNFLFSKLNFFYTFSTNYSDAASLFSNTAFYFDVNQKLFISKLVNEFELSVYEYNNSQTLFNPSLNTDLEDFFLKNLPGNTNLKKFLNYFYPLYKGRDKISSLEPFYHAEYVKYSSMEPDKDDRIITLNLKSKVNLNSFNLDLYARYLDKLRFSNVELKENLAFYLQKHDILINYSPIGFFDYNPRFYSPITMSKTSLIGLDSGFWLQDDFDNEHYYEDESYSEELFFYDDEIGEEAEPWDYNLDLFSSWLWILLVANFHSSSLMDNQHTGPLIWKHSMFQKMSSEDEDFYTSVEEIWDFLDDCYPFVYKRYPTNAYSFFYRSNNFRLVSDLDYFNYTSFPWFFNSSWVPFSSYYWALNKTTTNEIVDYSKNYHLLYEHPIFTSDERFYRLTSRYSSLFPNKFLPYKHKVFDLENFPIIYQLKNIKNFIRYPLFDINTDLQSRPFDYISKQTSKFTSKNDYLIYNRFERYAQNRLPLFSSFWTLNKQYPWHVYLKPSRFFFISTRYSWGWGFLKSKQFRFYDFRSTAGRKKRFVYTPDKNQRVYSNSLFGLDVYPIRVLGFRKISKRFRRYRKVSRFRHPWNWNQPWIILNSKYKTKRYRSRRDHLYLKRVFDNRLIWLRRIGYKLDIYKRVRYMPRAKLRFLKMFRYRWVTGRDRRRLVKRTFFNYFTPYFKDAHDGFYNSTNIEYYKTYYNRFHKSIPELVTPDYTYLSQVVRYSNHPKLTYLSYYDRTQPSFFGKRFGIQDLIKESNAFSKTLYISDISFLTKKKQFLIDITGRGVEKAENIILYYFRVKFHNLLNRFFEFLNLVDWYIFTIITNSNFATKWFGDNLINVTNRYYIFFLFSFLYEDFGIGIASTFSEYLTSSIFPSYFISIYTISPYPKKLFKFSNWYDNVASSWTQILSIKFSDFSGLQKIFYTLVNIPEFFIFELEDFYSTDPFTFGLFVITLVAHVIGFYIMRFVIDTDFWFEKVDAAKYSFFLHNYLMSKPSIWWTGFIASKLKVNKTLSFYTSKVFSYDPLLIYKLFNISQAQSLLAYNDFRQFVLYPDPDLDHKALKFFYPSENLTLFNGTNEDPYIAPQDPLLHHLESGIEPENLEFLYYISPYPTSHAYFELKELNDLGSLEPSDYMSSYLFGFNELYLEHIYSDEMQLLDIYFQRDFFLTSNIFLDSNNLYLKDPSFITSSLTDFKASDFLKSFSSFSSFNSNDFKLVPPYVSYYENLINKFVISNTEFDFSSSLTVYSDNFSDYICEDGYGSVASISPVLYYNINAYLPQNQLNPVPYYLLEDVDVTNTGDSWKYNTEELSFFYFGSFIQNQVTDRQELFDFFMAFHNEKQSSIIQFEHQLDQILEISSLPLTYAAYVVEKNSNAEFEAYIYSFDHLSPLLDVLVVESENYQPIEVQFEFISGYNILSNIFLTNYHDMVFNVNPLDLIQKPATQKMLTNEITGQKLLETTVEKENKLEFNQYQTARMQAISDNVIFYKNIFNSFSSEYFYIDLPKTKFITRLFFSFNISSLVTFEFKNNSKEYYYKLVCSRKLMFSDLKNIELNLLLSLLHSGFNGWEFFILNEFEAYNTKKNIKWEFNFDQALFFLEINFQDYQYFMLCNKNYLVYFPINQRIVNRFVKTFDELVILDDLVTQSSSNYLFNQKFNKKTF